MCVCVCLYMWSIMSIAGKTIRIKLFCRRDFANLSFVFVNDSFHCASQKPVAHSSQHDRDQKTTTRKTHTQVSSRKSHWWKTSQVAYFMVHSFSLYTPFFVLLPYFNIWCLYVCVCASLWVDISSAIKLSIWKIDSISVWFHKYAFIRYLDSCTLM